MPSARDDNEVPEREFRDLERLLGQLHDCLFEMDDDEFEFVDDLICRTIDAGEDITTQHERRELGRLERRYLP